jgi:cyclic beta-1,2-glucan synthetase
MGWERKRGKLHELNRMLRGAVETSFMVVAGKLPDRIRFVLTLDADTRLPRDAARRMIGKMAHPLNVARFDQAGQRVTHGYGVMQPRLTPSLPVGHRGSPFQRVFSSTRGMDPYAFAISDVYQDLFGQGSFAGKGIYDIDAFESALANRIPENTMLSHDLFEGTFARSALVTDVEVVEEYPERYSVASARDHRWIRGDWQLLPWILGSHRVGGPVPALGQWKMIDNIRRSLAAPLTVLCLFTSWIFLPSGVAGIWTVLLALFFILPPLLPAFTAALPRKPTITMESRAISIAQDLLHAIEISFLQLILLAHQAGMKTDAIGRTLYRLCISHKNLLEWTTAAQAHANSKNNLSANYLLMPTSVLAGLLALVISASTGGATPLLAVPFAVAWLLAPAVASTMSRMPLREDALQARPRDRVNLRMVARRTWRYFDKFVNAAENMLPPDNFQETPNPVVAHRTSPTNIGLYLLSVASAHDFGWIGLIDALARIENTVATLAKLEKFRGHLYNWYETTTLATLEPRYVSTVDSGNLAGHLIALSNCLTEWTKATRDGRAQYHEGLSDVLNILEADLTKLSLDQGQLKSQRKQVLAEVSLFRSLMEKASVPAVQLIELAVQASKISTLLDRFARQLQSSEGDDLVVWANALKASVESHIASIHTREDLSPDLVKRVAKLNSDVRELALSMEFGFLLDPRRLLFSIGYRVAEAMRDESCYDMLASEARLASFFAIAKGDLRTRHWFRLGRTVTAVRGGAALVSWSGSMFEYLMPSLVMRAPGGGLLDQTMHLVVNRQIEYAKGLGIPWGISESAFNARDIEFTYQYSNFGVPGLGLKRGLANNRVIAPYATALAAMVAPYAATANFEKLTEIGAAGNFGFYESVDFTPSRLRRGQTAAVVRAYFAHHQGMTIVALLNTVKAGLMRNRFHQEPMIRASELLLQERAPREVPLEQKRLELPGGKTRLVESAPALRRFDGIADASPSTHLLSNGRYSVMLTAAGSGYSNWNGLAVTRWREDGVCDDWGSFIYLRDPKSNKVWSAGYMPVGTSPDSYSAIFSEDKAEFRRGDGNILTNMECVVSAEDDSEARRVTLTNTGLTSREIEFTSYSELVLGSAAADLAHPAFLKMFVVTEFVPELETLIATRRKRSPNEPDIWVGQFLMVKGRAIGDLQFETDRAQFLGAGGSLQCPFEMASAGALKGSLGSVLDPAFVMRRRLRIPAGRQVSCTVWTVVSTTRQDVIDLVDRHRQDTAYDRALTLAWTQAQIQLRHLSISTQEAHLYQALAGHLIYANSALRPSSTYLLQNAKQQSALWQASISGDRPILLLRIDDIDDIEIVNQLLNAFVYWKTKRLAIDLVILNDRMSSYVQDLQSNIEALVRKINLAKTNGAIDGLGNVFTLRGDIISAETLVALPAAARAVIYARRGSLAVQLARLEDVKDIKPRQRNQHLSNPAVATPTISRLRDVEFDNGFGGFADNGREYVITLGRGHVPPAPWINVIANPGFGFQVSADGGGYTWFGNSRENKLTSWTNDPVCNLPSEVIYVQDETDGEILSPTFAPLKSAEGVHRTRHGFGYTVFEHETPQLDMELLQLVPLVGSVKISRLKLTNKSNRVTSFRVTHYADWVLGIARSSTSLHLNSVVDERTGAILMRNPWGISSPGQVAFVDMGGRQTNWTCDRREFLGSYGALDAPESLLRGTILSNHVGAGMDPCSVLQTVVTVEPGATVEVKIVLGAASNLEQAQGLISHYGAESIDKVLAEVTAHWASTLQQTQVKTPDRSMDIMLNGWLLYQTIACRMWARSGFYQVSGAFGFRDQLQDSMALLSSRPELARAHILEAASRQFVQGDFQHWWLPATGAGVRTRISDDLVWLANCVHRYVKVTGDRNILDERVTFIEGQPLVPGEHDAFFTPAISDQSATLYEHCAVALDRSLSFGAHGLPLFGTGDWNDGMNRVGEGGKGESVWLGWFLYATLQDFTVQAESRGDQKRVADWRQRARDLKVALEEHGWDGNWYRRGFYDDGSLLGSASSDECQIDAIAQSWSVISGAANPDHAKQAMDESYTRLAGTSDKVVRLFTPPFDHSSQDPGYIKAYPPGIRENGGQYTHGVIWSIFAHAQLQEPQRALELFYKMNPINHASDEASVRTYRVEPYVIAADVYSVAPHVGRGGWTWYTGSSGWMYRAGLEAILGISRESNVLRVKPSVPEGWNTFEVSTKFGNTLYRVTMARGATLQHEDAISVTTITPGEYLINLQDIGGTQQIVLPLVGAEET